MLNKLFAFLLSIASLFGTTLTGTLKAPDGTGMTGYLYFSVAQQAALSSSGSCGGPLEIVPTYEVKITVTNGSMVMPPSIYGNDCMLPQGIYYNVHFDDTNGNVLMRDRWLITGSSINIGTIVSVVVSGTTSTLGSVGVLLTQPSGNQIVNQPGGTTTAFNFLNVTDTFTFPNGAICNTGGCTGLVNNVVTTDTTQNISGAKTFTTSLRFAANTDVGTPTAPARYGIFSDTVVVPQIKLIQGSPAAPTDFFIIEDDPTALHTLNIKDSVNNFVATFGSGADPGGSGLWSFSGFVYGTLGLYNRIVGSAFDCTSLIGLASGGEPQFVVTTTSPPQIMVCIEGVKYKVDLEMP